MKIFIVTSYTSSVKDQKKFQIFLNQIKKVI